MQFKKIIYFALLSIATGCDYDATPGLRILSFNSKLDKIDVSVGILNPEFDPNIFEYAVELERENYAITVIPAPTDSLATAEMILDGVQVDSTFRLQVGLNKLVVRVTSENELRASEYTLNINRKPIVNTAIDTLIATHPPIYESYSGSNYELVFDESVDHVDLEVLLEDSLATSRIVELNSKASLEPEVTLRPGINHMEILVIADDNQTSKRYDLTITRNPWKLVQDNAPFGRRDGIGLVEFKGQLWMFGGYPFERDENLTIWVSSDGENWDYAARTPNGMHRHGVTPVVFQEKIWVISGDGLNDVWNSEDGVNWNRVAVDLPWGYRYSPYIFSFKNRLWLMGGFSWWDSDGNFVIPEGGPTVGYNDVWTSEDGINWTKLVDAAPWSPRGMTHGSVIFDGKMWIIGGGLKDYDTIEALNDVWYSEDGIHWHQMPDAPWERRYHFSAAVFDNKIWITDGSVHPRQANRSNEVWFTEDGASWIEFKGSPWEKRHASGLIGFRNKLILMCGQSLEGLEMNDIWKLEAGYSY